jgi:hypothetical protein
MTGSFRAVAFLRSCTPIELKRRALHGDAAPRKLTRGMLRMCPRAKDARKSLHCSTRNLALNFTPTRHGRAELLTTAAAAAPAAPAPAPERMCNLAAPTHLRRHLRSLTQRTLYRIQTQSASARAYLALVAPPKVGSARKLATAERGRSRQAVEQHCCVFLVKKER